MSDPTRSKAIEVMALSSCSKVGDSPPCRVACSGCKRHMDIALTAYESHLSAEGMVVVPVAHLEPFAKIALLRDTFPGAHEDRIDAPDLAITPADVRKVRAMLSASPYGKAKEESK